jgi:hypothetical protein
MKRSVHLSVWFAAALVTSCASSNTDLMLNADSVAKARIAVGSEQVDSRMARLEQMPIRLPNHVPLKLFPLLRHVNARLRMEDVPVSVWTLWKPPLGRTDWVATFSVADLAAMGQFEGSTESEIRQEIADMSIGTFLYRLAYTYGLSLIHMEDYILLTPVIAEPHEYDGRQMQPD